MNNIINSQDSEKEERLNIFEPAFATFICAKLISLPTVIMIFAYPTIAWIFLTIYAGLIFISVGLCIKKMFFTNNNDE